MKTTWMLLDSQLSGRGYKKQTQPGQHLFSQPDLLRDPFVNQNKWGGRSPLPLLKGFPEEEAAWDPKQWPFTKHVSKQTKVGFNKSY
jgi:hypothetical protein